jgi:uncharacterized membrane protein YbhN (UPF0104 family)
MRQVFGPGSRPLSRIMGGLVFLGGLALLGSMLWQVGLAGLRASFQALGPWVAPFLLLDSISLLLHTVGWAACFQRHQLHLRIWQLCLVRMAGNAINRVTPTADLGGEVVKVRLLTSALPQAQAVATVLIDKASIALAQMGYLTPGTLYLTGHLPLPVGVQRGVRLSMGLILLGLVGFVAFQRYGLLSKLVRGLGCLNIGQARLHQLSQRLAPWMHTWSPTIRPIRGALGCRGCYISWPLRLMASRPIFCCACCSARMPRALRRRSW